MVCAVNDDGETPERLLASTVTLTTEVAMSSACTVTSFAGWNLTVPGLVTICCTPLASCPGASLRPSKRGMPMALRVCVCVCVCVQPFGVDTDQ